jgi:pilus assembly protein CpaE
LPFDPETGFDVLRKLRRLKTNSLLVMGHSADSKLILRALQAGADYYLDEADLDASLEAILERLQGKGEKPSGESRMLAVLPACGGCGASTLAVNIAVTLARENRSCLLVDLKPGRGDLATLLDLKPSFTLADLCLNLARLDQAMFDKVLAPHACGLQLLSAPQMFGDARVVTSQGVSQALQLATRRFHHIVVDLEDCFHEEQQVVLRQAARIMLTVRMDFTALRSARRILDHLNELDIPAGRVRLVANRFGQANELPIGEAEEALGMPLAHYIPDDPATINKANNTGVPVVLKAPMTKVAQSIEQLAAMLQERRRDSSSAFNIRRVVAKLFSR